MKKGILLIAVGNPYYGKQAYNLAVTIKANEQVPITLVYDDKAIAHLHPLCLKVFDNMVKSPLTYTGMEAAMELRTMLPKISPYQVTLSLDVDMAWLGGKSLVELFELITDEQPITYVNEGYFSMEDDKHDFTPGYSPWCDPTEVKKAYGLKGKLYMMRGEFILFKKSKAVIEAFKLAQQIRRNPKLLPHKLAGAITEEFALNIAMNLKGLKPHTNRWPATYWAFMNINFMPPIKDLRLNYYALSAGGNTNSTVLQNTYNLLVKAACAKIGLPFFYPLQAKRNNIPERITR